MRLLCLLMVLAVAGLTWLGGCDGDDGGGGSLLAQGTMTIPASTTVDVATIDVSEPGTLQARVTWSSGPTEVFAGFRHVATNQLHGMAQSPSPLTTTAAVTSSDVAAGSAWLFRAAETEGTAVTIQYEVRFFPN
jgi:hypothetical protein